MPFRVREYQAAADGRVASVVAQEPVAGQEDNYSFLPDVSFKASKAKAKGLAVDVNGVRKTSVVNSLRAPKGFQFLGRAARA